jgi:hypothetical protein
MPEQLAATAANRMWRVRVLLRRPGLLEVLARPHPILRVRAAPLRLLGI